MSPFAITTPARRHARVCAAARCSIDTARSPVIRAPCASSRARRSPRLRPWQRRRRGQGLRHPTTGSESDSFSYTVSHDLRAPIRVVEGFTKIVKETTAACSTASATTISIVCSAPQRAMNNMIDALLSLSKLSSQPLVRQGVNLSQLAAYVADDLRRQSPGRQVGIEIEPDMQIEGDPTLLRVVVENLLATRGSTPASASRPRSGSNADRTPIRS